MDRKRKMRRPKIGKNVCRDCGSNLHYEGKQVLDSGAGFSVKLIETGLTAKWEGQKLFAVWRCTNPQCGQIWIKEAKKL